MNHDRPCICPVDIDEWMLLGTHCEAPWHDEFCELLGMTSAPPPRPLMPGFRDPSTLLADQESAFGDGPWAGRGEALVGLLRQVVT